MLKLEEEVNIVYNSDLHFNIVSKCFNYSAVRLQINNLAH